MFLSEP